MDSDISKSINFIIIFLFIFYIIIAYIANEISYRTLNTKNIRSSLENCKYNNNRIKECDYKPFINFIGIYTAWILLLFIIFLGIIYLTVGADGLRGSFLDAFIYPEISYMLLNSRNIITIYFLTTVIVLFSIYPLTKAINKQSFYINDISRRSSLNVIRTYSIIFNILISALVLIFITTLIKTAYYDILFGYLLKLKIVNRDRFIEIIERNLTYLEKIIKKYNNKF